MHPIRYGATDPQLPKTLRPTGGRLALAWHPEERVDPNVRDQARRHVRRLARMMQLDREPTIRWFGQPVGRVDFYADPPAPDVMPLGYTPLDTPNTIGLLKGIRGLMLAETVAHEMYHLLERKRGHLLPEHDDAYAFGEAYRLDIEDPLE